MSQISFLLTENMDSAVQILCYKGSLKLMTQDVFLNFENIASGFKALRVNDLMKGAGWLIFYEPFWQHRPDWTQISTGVYSRILIFFNPNLHDPLKLLNHHGIDGKSWFKKKGPFGSLAVIIK